MGEREWLKGRLCRVERSRWTWAVPRPLPVGESHPCRPRAKLLFRSSALVFGSTTNSEMQIGPSQRGAGSDFLVVSP